jgi:hypothetical protein
MEELQCGVLFVEYVGGGFGPDFVEEGGGDWSVRARSRLGQIMLLAG